MGDLVSDALSHLMNCSIRNKEVCTVKPVNKLLKDILKIFKTRGYVGEYEYIDNKKGGVININLIGKINKIGPIKPRFPCKAINYEKFEKRYLPSAGFGLIIVSTSGGVMTHEEAKKKKLGGRLIAYVY